MLWALSISACVQPTPKPFDPLSLLKARVDPQTEAKEVLEHLEAQGFAQRQRIDGEGYVAFDARRPDASLVRVVTHRGTVLAIDAPDSRDEARVSVELLGLQGDLDGDGSAEIVVSLRQRDREKSCSGVFRILPNGVVSGVPMPLEEIGHGACIESFKNVAFDEKLEAIAVIRFPAFGTLSSPELHVPIRSLKGDWQVVEENALELFWESEERRLSVARDVARAEHDIDGLLAIAVESAMVAARQSNDASMWVSAFHKVLKGVEAPTEEVERLVLLVRGMAETTQGVLGGRDDGQ